MMDAIFILIPPLAVTVNPANGNVAPMGLLNVIVPAVSLNVNVNAPALFVFNVLPKLMPFALASVNTELEFNDTAPL